MADDDQPPELRAELEEAEALLLEWSRVTDVQNTHVVNLERLARLFALDRVMTAAPTFYGMERRAMVFLLAAWQLGRASV